MDLTAVDSYESVSLLLSASGVTSEHPRAYGHWRAHMRVFVHGVGRESIHTRCGVCFVVLRRVSIKNSRVVPWGCPSSREDPRRVTPKTKEMAAREVFGAAGALHSLLDLR